MCLSLNLWVQQSPDIASTIDAIAFFGAIASIVDAILGYCWTNNKKLEEL